MIFCFSIIKRVFLLPQISCGIENYFCNRFDFDKIFHNVTIVAATNCTLMKYMKNRSSDFLLNFATSISRNNFDSFSTRYITLKFYISCTIANLLNNYQIIVYIAKKQMKLYKPISYLDIKAFIQSFCISYSV